MKSILTTCTLFLVLPWKLTGQTTIRPRITRPYTDTSNFHETSIRSDEPTIFSPNNKHSLKPNGETSHSPHSAQLHQGLSTGHETTIRGDEPTIFYSTNIKLPLKTNGLHEGTSKDNKKTTRGGDEYTTEENENVLSSESPQQTLRHQANTSLSHVKYLTQAMMTSTGENRSSSNLSLSPFLTEFTQKRTITPQPQNTPEEVITTRNDHQTLYNFKSTNKGLDRYTQGNRTTRSVEKESSPDTGNSTHLELQEVTTIQSVVDIQTTEILTTEWSSSPKEKESTQPPMLTITASNGTLNNGTNGTLSNQERNDIVTYPLDTSVTTVFSTSVGPTVKTEVDTSGTTDIMDKTATFEITTKGMISESKPYPIPNTETTLTTQRDNIKTTIKISHIGGKNKHPGTIVASLIGSILFLMFIAFLAVLARNRRIKKKKMENTDWAGPSPFIDGETHPNLPNVSEDGPFNHRDSRRISLNSFLPQRLSKRFSMLSPMEEEVPLENIQVSSTFGHHNDQPLNGKEQETPDQTQTHDANSSLPEVSSDSTAPEPVSIPPAPENNEKIQPEPKLDDEIIPAPPAETNSITPTPFEEVDLNGSPDKNAESTSPSDAIHIPSPPPLAPS
ncbi:protein EVI2B [Hemibagrus wyckioides]|uniref:protein EVI2B n=1 Tax=Hemibagrus wyckioides TaxID=337641 RepID=UPI00266B6D54|nr:protein EVI2B [Hemibagrus wyckioides]